MLSQPSRRLCFASAWLCPFTLSSDYELSTQNQNLKKKERVFIDIPTHRGCHFQDWRKSYGVMLERRDSTLLCAGCRRNG